jgi:hypothetical protein
VREVVFYSLQERPGFLEARSEDPALTIAACTFEELRHEARDSLIAFYGTAHHCFRILIRRSAGLWPSRAGLIGQRPSIKPRSQIT